MLLSLEPEEATTSWQRTAGGTPRIERGRVFLDVEVPEQEGAHWCWAAIAVGLERYYGLGVRTQEAFAHTVLGSETPTDLDRDFALDRALSAVGCYSHWSPGKPTLPRLHFEINLGRPVAVRIEWHGGVGHYVLVTGYDMNADYIQVADPRRGTAWVAFASFPSRYDAGGAWTESFWTTPPTPLITRS